MTDETPLAAIPPAPADDGILAPVERPRRSIRTLATLAAVVVGVATGCLVAITNAAWIQDAIAGAGYDEPAPVAAVRDRIALTGDADFLFAASHPELLDGSAFDAVCGGTEDDGYTILGCYTDRRIIVRPVADERLAGVTEVTMAHELLHAVWERMSADERDRIGALLEDEYRRVADDPAFADRLEWYARTEPGQRLNELHSIIGSEVPDLDPALEAHYARWFTDRGVIVALSEHYEAAFADLEEEAAALADEVARLEADLSAAQASYADGITRFEADVREFSMRADTGWFDSQEQFDAEQDALIARQEALQEDRDAVDDLATELQHAEAELADVRADIRDLAESIDGTS